MLSMLFLHVFYLLRAGRCTQIVCNANNTDVSSFRDLDFPRRWPKHSDTCCAQICFKSIIQTCTLQCQHINSKRLSLDWAILLVGHTGVITDKPRKASGALRYFDPFCQGQRLAEIIKFQPSQKHCFRARHPCTHCCLCLGNDGRHLLLLACDEHWGRALVEEVPCVIFILGPGDWKGFTFKPKELRRQGDCVFIEIPFV